MDIELFSHSEITSMLIFVVVEKFTKNGVKLERLFILFSFILNKNFSVLNSFEFTHVSVLCMSLAISLKNNFTFALIKLNIDCCSTARALMLLNKVLLFLGDDDKGELYWFLPTISVFLFNLSIREI